jgi:hypothetical protein
MAIENQQKRFLGMSIEKGFITQAQAIDTRKIQVRQELEKLEHKLAGEILVDRGLMTRSQVKEVLVALMAPSL